MYLRQRSNLARIIAIALSLFTLFVFPVGTIISIGIISYLVFFERSTFEKIPYKNLPYRLIGTFLICFSIIGLITSFIPMNNIQELFIASGSFSVDEYMNDYDEVNSVIIVMKGDGVQASSIQNPVIQDIQNNGGSIIGRTYYVANTIIADVGSSILNQIASNPDVIKIIPNKKIVRIIDFDKTYLLDTSHTLINADMFWDNGITGKGITVAIVDTGINDDITPLIRDGESIVIDGYAIYGDYSHWHGTCCASCIASQDPIYRGISPDVDLLDVCVFQSDGSATLGDIIQGWEWVANWKNINNRFVIVSNSFGATAGSDMGLLNDAANKMSQIYNIPMVCAAGNEGPMTGTISTPGTAEHVLTVGAVDDTLTIASFSSRGPSLYVDKKPDITAPGVNIKMFDSDGDIVTHSGTSFSTPITAGAMALLAQDNIEYTPDQFYNAFRIGARDLGASGFDYDYGYGFIDINKAYEILGNMLPGSIQPFLLGGFFIFGLGIVSYPEWRKKK